jgi:hypothetical protein
MRRSPRCGNSCAPVSAADDRLVPPAAFLPAVDRFSIMARPLIVSGEMAEWSKAHPC